MGRDSLNGIKLSDDEKRALREAKFIWFRFIEFKFL